MKYKVHLFSLLFLVLLILVIVSQELSSAEPGAHLMYAEDSSDSSVQFVEDDRDQSLVPQHESAEDYSVTRVAFHETAPSRRQTYYATPGTLVEVRIDIEVQHDNFSYNLMVRIELRSVADSNSNESESESHGTADRPTYVVNPYVTFALFTLSNDSDGREYFVTISVLLPDDSWAIIYDEKDSSFPDGSRLSTKNPQNVDTDNDGLSDAKEIELGTDFLVNDTDGDGVIDGDEVDLGTDPLDRDTDGDGVIDGDEVDIGRNPRVSESTDTLNYGSLPLFIGIFAVAFFIVTITLTRRGAKR